MARLSLTRCRIAAFRITGLAAVSAISAAMTPSCFITSTPDFQPPAQAPPLLDGNSASPPLGEIIMAQPGMEIDLKAGLRSEDAGTSVKVVLYVDYGLNTETDRPYELALQFSPLAPSTMSDGSRYVSIPYKPEFLQPGCHRLTMMVSHEFALDPEGVTCPADLTDSSALSWDLLLCSSTTSCPAFDPTSSCEPYLDTERDCPASFPPSKASTTSGSGG